MLVVVALALLQAPVPQPRYEESFENRDNLDPLHAGWERVHSPDHPGYNEIAVDRDPAGAVDGLHLLRMTVRGGGAGFQMTKRAAWRIDAGRPYRLALSVRMKGASRNTAIAALQWFDRKFALLREDVSTPLTPVTDWTLLALDVPFPPSEALWARVRLEYAGGDVRGECRFDGLSLMPTTRLEMAPSGRRLPIYEPDAPARFEVAAYGLAPGAYTVTLRTAAHASPPADLRPGKPTLVELPPHAPGYYDLAAEVRGPAGLVIRREVSLVVPNPWVSRAKQARWIGASVNLFTRDLPDAAGLAHFAGFDRIRLTLADHSPPGRRAPEESRLSDAARTLAVAEHAHLIGVLARPTPALFPSLGAEDIEFRSYSFSQLGRGIWEKPLRTLAMRHAGGIERWEVGEGPTAVQVSVESLLRPDAALQVAPTATRTLLPPAGADLASTAAFLRALLERAAAEDRPEAVYVPLDVPLIDAEGWPRAPLAALRAANDLLSGARVRREALPLLNVRELVFEKDGAALLALWNDVETEREAHLGEGAILYPPLGTARPHRPGERLKIGPMPLFVAKMDALVLESQSGLHFYDPLRPERPEPRLPLRVDPSTRLLKYRNLSRTDALTDVRIRILGPIPPGWQIRPTDLRAATLGPEEEVAQETLFVLPPGAEEQTHDLKIELSFRKNGLEQSVRVTRTLEVASAIGIEVSSTPDGANALRVTLRFSNRETRPLSFLARIRLPGLPEQEEPLGPLQAGAVRTLDFRVRDAHLVDPTRLVAEVIAEERGGERAYARKLAPLR